MALAAHGISLGQPPRYAAGFAHFQYANPAAPKGGSFSLPVAGGFDTLNPFTLKGDHEAGVATLTLDKVVGWEKPVQRNGETMGMRPSRISIRPRASSHRGWRRSTAQSPSVRSARTRSRRACWNAA